MKDFILPAKLYGPGDSPAYYMSKREYFAAMAMQGYLANDKTIGAKDKDLAHWSVRTADALIKALNEMQTT